jgi:ankyrin repeat protein
MLEQISAYYPEQQNIARAITKKLEKEKNIKKAIGELAQNQIYWQTLRDQQEEKLLEPLKKAQKELDNSIKTLKKKALMLGLEKNDANLVEFILANGVDTINKTKALSLARQKKLKRIETILLEYGAINNSNAADQSSIDLEKKSNIREVISKVSRYKELREDERDVSSKLIRKEGINTQISNNNSTARINIEQQNRKEKKLKKELAKSEQIREKLTKEFKEKALLKAFSQDDSYLVNALAEYGADVNIKKNGASLLFLAAEEGRNEIVKILLAHDAKTEEKSFLGFSPLIIAAIKNNPLAVKLLLEKEADVNAKAPIGFTAEDFAHYYEREEICTLLKEHKQHAVKIVAQESILATQY